MILRMKTNLAKKIKVRGRELPITQLLSWEKLKLDPKRFSQQEFVLAALMKFGPLSSRALSNLTGYERTNICRLLKDLENQCTIRVSHIAKCQITNRHVQFYDIDDQQDGQLEMFG